MPVDMSSRYNALPVTDETDRTGHAHPTIGLRLVAKVTPAIFSHRLLTLETMELLAWQQYNNSAYWWRIADANPRVFPLDWNAGDRVLLPAANATGLVQRTRKF